MLSFKLPSEFVAGYRNRPVDWGFQDAAGNSLGEIVFLRTYSRLKDDGTKETWAEVCERVINGMYSIQRDHARANCLPWSDDKATRSAMEAFERLFELKWTPPGRGLWAMGTPLVHEHRNSAALQNCAFISTAEMSEDDPGAPFAFLMEASMLGVGVGFDTAGADNGLVIHAPSERMTYIIPDTREGWAASIKAAINAYLKPGAPAYDFDYSRIRPEGSPIRTFGGTASGPAPLRRFHDTLAELFDGRAGEALTTVDIADIGNLIAVCVVSGNVRRSAEILLGSPDDSAFLALKDRETFPQRNSYAERNPGWAWASNNSVIAHVGQDLTHIVPRIVANGEPGVVWLDTARRYGRLADPANDADWRLAGFNPCGEQGLESREMCTLVDTFIGRHESEADFLRTLKYAYLYAKTVTLLPTQWPETNAIMQRNRRIGTSISGIADFADERGLIELRQWMDDGYHTVQRYDRVYSEWLGIRESIKTTTVKPSGTVSLLAGSSPGVHWSPATAYYYRTMRLAADDPLVQPLSDAGYRLEAAAEDPAGTVVAYFPIRSDARRSDRQVSIFEKAHLASLAQHWWSDNSVSVTLGFDPEMEGEPAVSRVLEMYAGQLKSVSFLPHDDTTYPQMPYTAISAADYEAAAQSVRPLDLVSVYSGQRAAEAVGEQFCTTDVCEWRAA